ncbi:MAG: hypothetical protein EXR92_04125 [Gemmatimonadetes bacterium]|nr:hypothetical protein [Gemmatimonadota bacterium]
MRQYYALLRSTSRTFAVGIEALPETLRDAVTLAYLVLRVSDYFEDSPSLDPEEKNQHLSRWAALLDQADRPPDPAAFSPLLQAVSAKDVDLPDQAAALDGSSILAGLAALPPRFREPIRKHTADTTRGMASWAIRGDDFPDEAALDRYMFEVAGRVGLLLTDLFAAHSEQIRERADSLREMAVSFGLGLQTVNVIRGLHEDPARGWSYVPRTVLPPAVPNVDLRRLGSEEQSRILDFLVRKAGRHIVDALDYCQALPRTERGIRIFCVIPALLASRTAAKSRRNPAVFRVPVRVTRSEVGRIILLSRILFFSNGWLERERLQALALMNGDGQ